MMTREEIGELIRKGPAGWAPVESALDALYARIEAAEAEIAQLTAQRDEALRERDETHAAKVLADREAYRIGLEYADAAQQAKYVTEYANELTRFGSRLREVIGDREREYARAEEAEALTGDLVWAWSDALGQQPCSRCWRPSGWTQPASTPEATLCASCFKVERATPTTGCG